MPVMCFHPTKITFFVKYILYVRRKPHRKPDFFDDLFYNIALLLRQAPRNTNILLTAITIRINDHTLQCMISFLDVTTNLSNFFVCQSFHLIFAITIMLCYLWYELYQTNKLFLGSRSMETYSITSGKFSFLVEAHSFLNAIHETSKKSN